MMAGVVAMAAVIEDFDTQPCKKSRKDEGSPIVKTITNYFSPVPKPVEKPFSPPRANNIMDYFMRKAPTKTSSPEQQKDNSKKSQLDEKSSSVEAAVKQPSQKRSRRAAKASRKLVEHETVSVPEKDSSTIVEKNDDKRCSAVDADKSGSVLKGDSTVQVVQHSPEDCVTGGGKAETVQVKNGNHEDGSKNMDNVNPAKDLNCLELSPIVPTKDKVKNVKSVAQNSRKKQHGETKVSAQDETSLCDVSVEVNVDEDSLLNRSTVTISFEDFVRSQSQDEADENAAGKQGTETKNLSEAEQLNTDQLDIPKAGEDVAASGEPSLQVSPRTVTVQADIHVVSPKQEAGKLASIFNRRKGATSTKEVVSSPHIDAGAQSPSASVAVKRKSNVVLQEDDLELAVLESESTPKCSDTERKQFMAAFKQASLDKSKTKPAKSLGKQKPTEEKVLDETDKAAEDETASPSPAPSQDNKVVKKKPARKGRQKAKEENEAIPTQPTAGAHVEETANAAAQGGDKKEEPPITSTSTTPVLRRSRREAVVRPTPESKPTPESTPTAPLGKTKQLSGAASPSPAKTRKSKHGVFVAQMVCPPDADQSPIRMKFIRVNRSVPATKAKGGCCINSLASNTSDESKKRKRAKTLVEKAKVIQQSKKAVVKEQKPLRRSSRSEATTKRSYCEDEDSVICLEEKQMTQQKTNTQNSLRSLNDVLGKSSGVGKETKAVPGSKGSSLGPEKSARKASAVISIFDDSSREGSENSQDDEQFRARREFLKSGLPESFRKQIAKSAATKEAYSLACSSFQPVTHVKQTPEDCPLWDLLWPQSSLLSHLQEVCCQTFRTPASHAGSLCVKTKPARGATFQEGSGWRSEISESVRQLLMEEVATSNPRFPVERFVAHFLKRRTDHQQQCTASEPETLNRAPRSTPAPEPVGGKRKRTDGEADAMVKVAKKQRANALEEKISPAEAGSTKRGGRTRRAQRSKPEEQTDDRTKAADKNPSVLPEDDAVIVLLDEDTEKKDVVKEDVLWTDKYQPQHSSDIVGNTASVRKLHSWLKEWKLRADREERKKQTEKKLEEGSIDSDWDCGELDSQEGEDMCNTLLITGPTGVGKTAAVYACAQELGFKVFEVNASSQRSGRLILSQLREATQSHQVGSQGAHKPSYFNSYGSSSTGALRPGSSPRKINSPRRVVSSPRKHPQSPRGAKRGGLAPTSLANFFKTGQPTRREMPNITKNEPTAGSKNITKASVLPSKQKDLPVNSPAATTPTEKSNGEQNKKTATSLILFEEVDVIFDDDSGFLAAIKTFMSTTKRPVILTTSDPAFSTVFDGNFEEIHFKAPSVLDAGSFLRSLCLAEDIRMDQQDVGSLLRLNGCDMRQSLLQLQFWTRSGGGRTATLPLSHSGKNAQPQPETDGASCEVTVPPCDTGCTESMLGLPNIAPKRDPWQLLKSCCPEDPLCWELLTNSKCRGVDLLYSNMETLLLLPLTLLTTSTCKPEQFAFLSKDEPPATQNDQPLVPVAESADCSDAGSPVKVSNRMKKTKRRRCLPDQHGLHSDLDSEDDFLTLSVPKATAQAKKEVKESLVSEKVKRMPLTPEERLKSLPVSKCLESIGDFLDNMSFLDSSLSAESMNGHRGQLPVVKDGMTDDSRLETDKESWMRGEHALEIQSAVEALSFHRCRVSVAEAWEKAQQLEGELRKAAAAELTLPVAAHLDGHTFSQDGPCQPQLVQQRREVMDNLMFRGTFGTLCNRSAVALSYLPALRTICRLEQLKEQGKVKRRFLHYLDSIHLGLEKSILQRLADDFP